MKGYVSFFKTLTDEKKKEKQFKRNAKQLKRNLEDLIASNEQSLDGANDELQSLRETLLNKNSVVDLTKDNTKRLITKRIDILRYEEMLEELKKELNEAFEETYEEEE